MKRLVWSPLAAERVAEAAEFIATDKPEAAVRWAEGVFEVVAGLATFPNSGTVVQEVGRDEVRQLLYGEYRVIYRVEAKRVLILTVRHGRRLLDETEIAGPSGTKGQPSDRR